MSEENIQGGVVHELPAELLRELADDSAALVAWNGLTPLARNEWICWIISVKQQATRENHLKRAITELKQGKRRPCCWIGCIHRTDKEISPSIRAILERKTRSK